MPYAEATVRTLDENLDARTTQWAQARAHACQATWVEQSASEAVFDRRVACLRDDLAGTDALVTRLESATPALAERAVSAVTRLPDPSRCTQPDRAAQDETPQVERLRLRLANARAAHLLAEYPKAREEAEAIANEAEQAGLLSLRGDALELWAKAQSSIEPASSGPQITAAFEIAVQLDESEAATERALSAASMLVDEHPEDGEQWMRHAHAALDRVTDPDFKLRARAEKVQCLVSGTLGKFEEALGHCERAMELVQQAPEPAADARWGVTMTTANALRDLGREKEAVVLLEQLRAEAIERNGANHPRVGGTTLNLGNSAKVNGDVARAVRLYQEAEKIFSVAYRPDHPWVVSSLLNRGGAELSRRNPEEAAKVFTRALELCGDREDSRMIRVMRMLAEARRHQGRDDVALELLTRVTDLEDELLPADHPHRSFTHHNRGMIYLRQGRLEEARKDFERSLHFHAGAPNTARAAQSHAELAKVAMLEKRFSDAELSIARAVKIHRSVASSPTDKAAIFIRQAEILIELEQFEAAQRSLDEAAPLIEQAEPELRQDLPEALIEVSARIPPRVQNANASEVQ